MGSGGQESSRLINIVRLLVPTCIVGLIGAVFWLTSSPVSNQNQAASSQVQLGKDYYVSIALLELSERDSDGDEWDGYNQTGPDIYVEIYWKGNRIYRSTTKEDTFVAKWSNAELDLRKVALTGQTTSLDGLIQAARLNIRSGETIDVRAYDADLVDTEEAGTASIITSQLKVGDTTYEYKGPGIRRMIVRVSDMSEPVDVSR